MISESRTYDKLQKLFNPKTIAIIGATDKEDSVGYTVVRNLIGSGFQGIVYPINPKRESILGVKAYSSIKETQDDIDLAIVASPWKNVPSLVRECGEAGVSGLVVVSAGFGEAGEQGKKALDEIKSTAREHGIRIIGPNCLGFMRPSLKLNASYARKMALPGRIAFISQSDALGTAVLDWSVKQNLGFSYFVCIGSMIDVGFNDLIDFCGQDSHTSSIIIYMESLTNARKFLSAARAFARTKPIIVLKAGRSSEGAQAAASHTRTLAGNDDVFDAAFKRAGVIRVRTVEELFNCAQTLAMQPRPAGNRLAIVTNAGGPGVIATDYLIEKGGVLAHLTNETMEKLNSALPDAWSLSNPVDIQGDADVERYRLATEICMDDPDVDGLLIILTPQAMTDADGVARSLASTPKRFRKTLLTSFMGEDDVNAGVELLEQGNIPAFNTPEAAVDCFMNMYSYSRNLDLLYETPESVPHEFSPRTEKNRNIIENVASENRFTLSQAEAREFLGNYDIPVIRSEIASTAEETRTAAEKIGFPVAVSILSPDVLHKTDVGGLELNIRNGDEAEAAYKNITASVRKHVPDADIQGVLVAEMLSKRYELIIGANKDPIFGPTIVFGLGGLAVEVFRDTSIGLPPLNMALARRLLEDTKIYTLLKGYRGIQGVDIAAIQFLLCKFAYLLIHFPEVKEININPFAVDHEGGAVLDAKVILDEDVIGKKLKPFSHLVISPYPQEYTTEFFMKNGDKVILRPIRPEDEPLEGEMFTTFSERTQRFRFFELIKDITHEMLIRYTQIDYDREIAIIAEHTDNVGKKRMLGVVRLISDPYNETAEFAIVVGDPWQGQGLGKKFMDVILDIARDRGVKKVIANMLKENMVMKHIFESRGFAIKGYEDMWYAELEL
jgi:acetyltransferase